MIDVRKMGKGDLGWSCNYCPAAFREDPSKLTVIEHSSNEYQSYINRICPKCREELIMKLSEQKSGREKKRLMI